MIDEQKLIDDVKFHCAQSGGTLSEDGIISIVRSQANVDAVPVVRCGDCEFFNDTGDGTGYCTLILDEDPWKLEDFCSYGEMMGD